MVMSLVKNQYHVPSAENMQEGMMTYRSEMMKTEFLSSSSLSKEWMKKKNMGIFLTDFTTVPLK